MKFLSVIEDSPGFSAHKKSIKALIRDVIAVLYSHSEKPNIKEGSCIKQIALNFTIFSPKDTFQIFETKLTLQLLAYQAQLSAELMKSQDCCFFFFTHCSDIW